MNPIFKFLNWRAQQHSEMAWGFMRLVPNKDERAQGRTLRRALVKDLPWMLAKLALIITIIAAWHVLGGCNVSPERAQLARHAEEIVKTQNSLGTHADKATASVQEAIDIAQEIPAAAPVIPPLNTAAGELYAVKVDLGSLKAHTLAQAKASEQTAKENARLERENAALKSEFQRTIFWFKIAITIATTAACILAVWWFKSPKLAISIAAGAVAAMAILSALSWIDLHMKLILGCIAGAAGLWIIVETVWRKFRQKLSWGAAFVTAISTTPMQDLNDISSPAATPVKATT